MQTHKKTHLACPNCECAISFDTAIVARDFAQFPGEDENIYKYFGAPNQEDNLSCLYCRHTLSRGVVVRLFVVPPLRITRGT